MDYAVFFRREIGELRREERYGVFIPVELVGCAFG